MSECCVLLVREYSVNPAVMAKYRILVVDDEESVRQQMRILGD